MQAPQDELALARIAFVAAHGRFQDDHASRDVGAWYASLGETLWWIFALDEHYRHRNQDAYERFRDSDGNGQVISALRLARNRVGHRLALMLEDPEGSVFTKPQASGVALLSQLTWRRLDDLPPADPGKERPAQQAAYRTYLEGNAARYALRRANYFFIRHRDQLDAAIT